MNNSELLRFIKDDKTRLIAKNANLVSWEWGTDSDLQRLAMIEGAAIMLQEFLDDSPIFFTGKEGKEVLLWKMLKVEVQEKSDDYRDRQTLVSWAEVKKADDEENGIYSPPL
jgi:hypothetical protein